MREPSRDEVEVRNINRAAGFGKPILYLSIAFFLPFRELSPPSAGRALRAAVRRKPDLYPARALVPQKCSAHTDINIIPGHDLILIAQTVGIESRTHSGIVKGLHPAIKRRSESPTLQACRRRAIRFSITFPIRLSPRESVASI